METHLLFEESSTGHEGGIRRFRRLFDGRLHLAHSLFEPFNILFENLINMSFECLDLFLGLLVQTGLGLVDAILCLLLENLDLLVAEFERVVTRDFEAFQVQP